MRLAPLISLLVLFAAAELAAGQTGIAGVVRDFRGHVLADADVQVQSESTGARWRTQSDDNGRFAVAGIPVGRYKVTVRMPGFRTVARVGLELGSAQAVALDFSMELLGLHEAITVVGDKDALDRSNGESLTLTRDRPGASLPSNGPDFRASFDLLPGVVVTPAAVSDAGQFTSNGQRPNSSSFRVDGVSGNTGVGGSVLPGSFPGASLPAMTAIGTAEDLASPSTAQSVELRTSNFAPEFGERSGAVALVTTRSGSNEFHGEIFGHIRDGGWTARDWFANSRGLPFPRPYYRSAGAVFSGPIWRNRTFLFVSAEESRVSFSGLELTAVPSVAARRNAAAALQPILSSFPLPTGPDLGDGLSEGLLALTRTASLTSYTMRIDQALGSHGNLFGRLVHSPSTSEPSLFDANGGQFHWDSATFGITAGRAGGMTHDLRLNYSRARLLSYLGQSFGLNLLGLARLTDLCAGCSSGAATVFGLSIPGLGQFVEGGLRNPRQDQWELRYTLAKSLEKHEFRAGIDYMDQRAWRESASAAVLAAAPNLQTLLTGGPLAVNYALMPRDGGTVRTLSLFVQDTFRAGERLSLTYGMRWELTPPISTDIQIPMVSGLWTGTDWRTVHSGDVDQTGPWPMRFGQIAPRVSLAYRLPGSSLILRAGAGVFYDTALGASINPINGAPFNSWQLAAGVTSAGFSAPGWTVPPGGITPDVQAFLNNPPPDLRLPTSYQWRASLEKGVGSRGLLSAAYTGSANRNLLGNQAYIEPDTGILTRFTTATRNSSGYHAMQWRYTGSIRRNLYVSAAYAWSHSIDDGSQDSSVFLIHPSYSLSESRASSSFDVRHSATGALSYRLPRAFKSVRIPEALAGWTLSGILRARTGFPVDIKNTEEGLGRGFDNFGRPDLIAGVPIWIDDSSRGGGRVLNPAAFRVPPAGTQGTLGRNAIYGNGLAQLDASLHREFPLFRRMSLQVGLNVFNVLNHPAFADPVPFLSSPFFGQSTSMQNLMLGSGAPNTGSPPLFQTGGARSAEFSFRFSF